MSRKNELRLLVKIASLYYNEKLKQSEIASMLHLSQAFVSRAITRSLKEGVVRINVIQPESMFIELESKIQEKYSIDQAIIVDALDVSNREQIKNAIGSAASHYLQTTIRDDDLVGISSWSSHITAMVNQLHPLNIKTKGIVQLLGGVGTNGNIQATILTQTLANYLNCPAYVLPSQSIEGSIEYFNDVISSDDVKNVIGKFKDVTLAIVGIGILEPSSLLKSSGNYYKQNKLELLSGRGAVGDICLHYFDENGEAVLSPDEDTVIGMQLEELKKCPRVVALAGGTERSVAIKAALRGNYVDVLITDIATAKSLL